MTNAQFIIELIFGVDTYDPTEKFMLIKCPVYLIGEPSCTLSSASISLIQIEK